MDKNRIQVAELIDNLRTELLLAEKAKDPRLVLEVEEIELEIQFTVTREVGAGAKAGLKFWVFSSVEGETSAFRASEGVQRVKLKLKPRSRRGRSLEVGDEVMYRD